MCKNWQKYKNKFDIVWLTHRNKELEIEDEALMNIEDQLKQAAEWIRNADSLLITAGAGIGVDSGLPDFRGTEGFWRAYPVLKNARLRFEEIANQEAFESNPTLAWGFYGHRLQLYRDTVPHGGFQILKEFAATKPLGAFVYTSNVDGQFQKAGFDPNQIMECHGSIHHLQCLAACTDDIWPADDFNFEITDDLRMRESDMPSCPHCGRLARPNVLMFGDWTWLSSRTDSQKARLDHWMQTAKRPAVIELGAGLAIPTVRRKGEALKAPLIRINPAAPEVSGHQQIGLKMGALQALMEIKARL